MKEGLSLRLIRDYRPEDDRPTVFDRVLVSCRFLGHTFDYNKGERYCGVCGFPNPATSCEPSVSP